MRDYIPYFTEDGSVGLYSYRDKDVYHSKFGALTEAWEKFIIPADIENLVSQYSEINILDICYGIGYNTKALMSFVINQNEKNLKRKNFLKILHEKINNKIRSIVTICANKLYYIFGIFELSTYNEKIYSNKNLTMFNIDCLDVNKELIKLSPFFGTLKTPEEYFNSVVPNFLNCFDSYYTFKDFFIDYISKFYPKNPKEINDLLNIKFKNMHIEKEYKVNELVNYILVNNLHNIYDKDFYKNELKKIIRENKKSHFYNKDIIKYAKFNRKWGYNKLSKYSLSALLHNIYYNHLSKRNKNIDFKKVEGLFNLNFYIKDARKSILEINRQYDCIFLDAFTYTKAPQLWTIEFIAELTKKLKSSGVILTYSNSAQIRKTFLENNLYVGKIYNSKTKKFMGTIASKDKTKIELPLNHFELGLCNTKAGIPYHDPNLNYTDREIFELREFEFRHSTLMSSSRYMKLRGNEISNEEI